MKVKKMICFALSTIVIGLTMAGCNGGSASTSGSKTGTSTKIDKNWYDADGFVHVKIATTVSQSTMDPLSTIVGATYDCLNDMIYDHLVVDNFDGTYSPQLATSWEENAAGTEWTFHLRKGVKFSDGNDFTANDVAATMQRFLDKKGTRLPVTGMWTTLTGYKVVNDNTIKIDFSAPYGAALASFSKCVVFCAADYKKWGDDYFNKAHCIGCGKWKVDKFLEKQSITLSLNKNYWGGTSNTNVQKITIYFVPENSSLVTGILSGSFDNITRIDNSLLNMLKGKGNLKIEPTLSNTILQVGLQCGPKSPFNDINVRKAFSYAINRKAICDNILPGSQPTMQYIQPSCIGYDSSLKVVYDPTQAKKLLSSSSYKGQKIVIQPLNTISSIDDIFASVCDNLKSVGFNVSYTKVESATQAQIRQTGDYDAYCINDNINPDQGVMIDTRFSNPGHHHNLNDQNLYSMIKTMDTTIKPDQRKQILTKINDAFYNDYGPVIPLVRYSFNNCTRVGLKGVVYTPVGGYWYKNITIG